MTLRAGGGALRLTRSVGTPGPVQEQRARGGRLRGATLATSLPTLYLLRARDGVVRLGFAAESGGAVISTTLPITASATASLRLAAALEAGVALVATDLDAALAILGALAGEIPITAELSGALELAAALAVDPGRLVVLESPGAAVLLDAPTLTITLDDAGALTLVG